MYRHHDPALFDLLHDKVHRRGLRNVNTAYMPRILPNSWLYDDLVPTDRISRKTWFETFLRKAHGSDLVFFDPDNGLEVSSVSCGTKDSPKYLYWSEVEQAYDEGHSLLVYQHFPRVSRDVFIPSLAARFRDVASANAIQAFSTSHVIFFLIKQRSFTSCRIPLCWGGQLTEVKINWNKVVVVAGIRYPSLK